MTYIYTVGDKNVALYLKLINNWRIYG